MRIAVCVLLVGNFVTALGCGGTDDPAVTACAKACDRDDMCIAGLSDFCEDDCPDRVESFLPEFRDVYFDCYGELNCDVSETTCEVEASSHTEVRSVDRLFATACQDQADLCNGTVDVERCFVSRYYREERAEAARLCLEMTCDAIDACLARELPFSPFR